MEDLTQLIEKRNNLLDKIQEYEKQGIKNEDYIRSREEMTEMCILISKQIKTSKIVVKKEISNNSHNMFSREIADTESVNLQESSKALYVEAVEMFKNSKTSSALNLVDTLLDNEKSAIALNLKAFILEALSEFEQAKKTYDEALKINPECEFIRVNRSKLLYDWAKEIDDTSKEKALELIEEAIEDASKKDMELFIQFKKYILRTSGQSKKIYYEINQNKKIEELKQYNDDTLINIVGYSYYRGINSFEEGMIISLVKEPNNEFDEYAIRAEIDGVKVGYVANSGYTFVKYTKCASVIYDLFKKSCKAEVLMIIEKRYVIARLLKDENGNIAENPEIIDSKDGAEKTDKGISEANEISEISENQEIIDSEEDAEKTDKGISEANEISEISENPEIEKNSGDFELESDVEDVLKNIDDLIDSLKGL